MCRSAAGAKSFPTNPSALPKLLPSMSIRPACGELFLCSCNIADGSHLLAAIRSAVQSPFCSTNQEKKLGYFCCCGDTYVVDPSSICRCLLLLLPWSFCATQVYTAPGRYPSVLGLQSTCRARNCSCSHLSIIVSLCMLGTAPFQRLTKMVAGGTMACCCLSRAAMASAVEEPC
jgi:hypothetical protein